MVNIMKNKLAIKLIKKYQESKDLFGRGHCHFYPSCSNYAIECYQKFNFFYASLLTLFRIIRCTPFSKRKYDPVPLSKKEKQQKRIIDLFCNKYSKPFYLNLLKAKDAKELEALVDEYIYPNIVNANTLTSTSDSYFKMLSSKFVLVGGATNNTPELSIFSQENKKDLVCDIKNLSENDILKLADLAVYNFKDGYNEELEHSYYVKKISDFSYEELFSKYLLLPKKGLIAACENVPTEFINFIKNQNIKVYNVETKLKEKDLMNIPHNELTLVIIPHKDFLNLTSFYSFDLIINFYEEEKDYSHFADYNFKI